MPVVTKLPFWATTLTAGGMIVLCGLGSWQLQRLQWKNDLLATLDQQYETTPPQISALSEELDLTRGMITGQFLQNKNIELKPRTHEGVTGVHVFTPFKTQSGETLLVNRGWAEQNHGEIKAPQGRQSLSGLFRAPSKPNIFVPQNTPDKGQWYRIDLAQMEIALKVSPLAPVILYTENNTGENLIPVGTKPELNNNHLQYAWFWFAMAAALLSVYILRFIVKKP
jgi:surfeit locus 1 family protein